MSSIFLDKSSTLPISDNRFDKGRFFEFYHKEYNSYGGNAYGLANTLMQTAFLRPKIKSKLVQNLYFCGQLTVPGPGVPPAIVSGELVAGLVNGK